MRVGAERHVVDDFAQRSLMGGVEVQRQNHLHPALQCLITLNGGVQQVSDGRHLAGRAPLLRVRQGDVLMVERRPCPTNDEPIEEVPALEGLLIDQIALTWLHFYYTQRDCQRALTRSATTAAQANYWEQRVNAAQRRYLRAIKALGRIRKMAGREVLQINIGDQQVNVAG